VHAPPFARTPLILARSPPPTGPIQTITTKTSAQAGVAAARTRELLTEIAVLRREAERHNTPATFARCAKLQRQAAAREKELEGLAAEAGGANRTATMVGTLKARRPMVPRLPSGVS